MTVKRALLAVALGTTLGTGYALWDERERGDGPISASNPGGAVALTNAPIAPARVVDNTVVDNAPPVLVSADAGALPPSVPRADVPARASDRLLADLERAKLESPPELDQLLKMQRRGAKPRALRSYVRAHFPKDARLRLVVGRWIKSLEPARAGRQAWARPRRHK
jgi:hypothetical protein